jgi:hypothetical protein
MYVTRVRAALWIATLALFLALFNVTLSAQWLTYPSKGLPTKADGSPNLMAPAPRTADGKPDLSGVWDVEKNRPCGITGCPDQAPQEYFNIGWALKEGLPYQPWAAALVKSRTAQNSVEDPVTRCLPIGVVHTHTTPLLKKIIQTPALLLILNERNASYRQIFIDGRPLPEDPQPSFNGYSTGKWEADTLVVQSNGFQDDIWLDHNGSPLTEAAKMTERFRRVTVGRLEMELTVDDPKAYTRPWTVKLSQNLVPDGELLDAYCLENEKDIQHFVNHSVAR